MSNIWIVWNQFQWHEYNLDCVKITNQSHDYYLECAFFTNQSRLYYLDHLFYSAPKSTHCLCQDTLPDSWKHHNFFSILDWNQIEKKLDRHVERMSKRGLKSTRILTEWCRHHQAWCIWALCISNGKWLEWIILKLCVGRNSSHNQSLYSKV